MKHTHRPWYRFSLGEKKWASENHFVCEASKNNVNLELLEALKFAKSVIQSGELWTETCEHMIDKIIARAEGKE